MYLLHKSCRYTQSVRPGPGPAPPGRPGYTHFHMMWIPKIDLWIPKINFWVQNTIKNKNDWF